MSTHVVFQLPLPFYDQNKNRVLSFLGNLTSAEPFMLEIANPMTRQKQRLLFGIIIALNEWEGRGVPITRLSFICLIIEVVLISISRSSSI